MSFVVAKMNSNSAIPMRLVGAVTESKDGSVTIDYKEPGMVKVTTKTFTPDRVLAHCKGDAGFVVALMNDPVATVAGEMVVKNGTTYIKSEHGLVKINPVPGTFVDYLQVEAESREAKAANRASKVKVRGVASKRTGASTGKKRGRKPAAGKTTRRRTRSRSTE